MSRNTKKIQNDKVSEVPKLEVSLAERYMDLMHESYPEIEDNMDHIWGMMATAVTAPMITRLEMTLDERRFWVNGEVTPLEKEIFVNPEAARAMLADAWSVHSQDVSIWGTLTRMWELGTFDAVIPNCVVIHSIPVEAPHRLSDKLEVDPNTSSAPLGRRDLTSATVMGMQWGTSEGNAVAVRGKISGIPFVKVVTGQTAVMQGSWSFPVPLKFPVEKAEFYGGQFYIVYPYSLPSFRMDTYSFVEHPWLHPVDFVTRPMYEGIMVLVLDCDSDGGTKEFRAKYVPTSEVRRGKYPWEAYIDDKGGLVYIRPRPGKPASEKRPMTTTCVTGFQIRQRFPLKKDYHILEVKSGMVERHLSIRGGGPLRVIRFDSGFRIDSTTNIPCFPSEIKIPVLQGISSQKKTHDLIEVVKDNAERVHSPVPCQTMKDVPVRSYVGSKLIISSASRLWLIKEGEKPMDFVGGQRETRESPLECLLREVLEETGEKIDPTLIMSLGSSDDMDKGVFARSNVFFIRSESCVNVVNKENMKSILHTDVVSYPIVQPWVLRILDYAKSVVGSLYNLYLSYGVIYLNESPIVGGVTDPVLTRFLSSHAPNWRKKALAAPVSPRLSMIKEFLKKFSRTGDSMWENQMVSSLLVAFPKLDREYVHGVIDLLLRGKFLKKITNGDQTYYEFLL